MTLFEFWALLRGYWRSIIGVALGVALIVGVHSVFVRPIYSASVILSPLSLNDGSDLFGRLGGQIGGLVGLSGLGSALGSGVGANKNEAIALLTSRGFTEQFIRDQNLLPQLFESKWDAARNTWRSTDPAEIPTVEDAFQKFDLHIRSVQEDEKTGLVTLEIRWVDRVKAAEWANGLVDAMNKRIRERTIDEAERSIAYLHRQIESTNVVSVQQAMFGVLEKNAQMATLAKVREDFAFRVVDRALPSDADKFVSPHRLLRVFVGFLVGFLLGIALAILRSLAATERRRLAVAEPTGK